MTKIIHEFFIDEYLDTELQRCYARVNRIEIVASVFVDFGFCQRCAFTDARSSTIFFLQTTHKNMLEKLSRDEALRKKQK